MEISERNTEFAERNSEFSESPIHNKVENGLMGENKRDCHCEVSLWQSSVFVFGLIALFFYVACQTGINSFFINYVTEKVPSISSRVAALILSFGGMGLFFVGRLAPYQNLLADFLII